MKHRQRLLEKKWDAEEKRLAEEAEKEEARVAKMEADARRKRLLIERQEDERLRQKQIQRKEKLAEEKWDKHFDTLLAQIKDRFQKDNDDKLEEIRVIIKNREPSLQELDWDSWLSVPLNQLLADLDFEYAMEMFKRDNLMAKRRKRTGGKKKYSLETYSLKFTGDTAASAAEDYVTTDFNPDDYNLNLGFTVSYWVKPDEVGTHMFAFGRKYSNSERFTFGIGSTTKIYIGVGNVKMECTWSGNCDDNSSGQTAAELFPSLFDSGVLKTGNWLHFAVTYADRESTSEGGVARKVYLNGELIQEANLNWSTTGGNMDDGMYFGGRSLRGSGTSTSYNNGWACSLDEVAIYDTVKGENFAAEVYNGRTKYDHTGKSNLVGYWKFNEGDGITVKDHSGNGNHGTFGSISGGTTAVPTWSTR